MNRPIDPAAFDRALAEVRQQSRTNGVRWSGLSDDLDRQPTVEQLQREQAKRVADREAYMASARGRFLKALAGVKLLPTYEQAGWKAHDAGSRGFLDSATPPSIGELGIALLALSDVPGNDARAAREALAEIMIESHRRAA